MKRIIFMLLALPLMVGVTFLSYSSNIFASEDAGHNVEAAEVEGIPFDRPVEEIQKSLAPMNELKLFKDMEIESCTECHDQDWETNPERRELEEPHDKFPGKFINHDSDNRWCLDCHSAKNRDKFRLINGSEVPFNEYYKVCAQCHRRIYREWKMGVHGKRTGYWNGEQLYRHCTQCHDPHNPPFKPIKPMPAPRKPLDVRIDTAETAK